MSAFMRAIDAMRDPGTYADFFANHGAPDFVVYWNYASPPNPRCTWCVWMVPTTSWECI
jgi:hypothetical protein